MRQIGGDMAEIKVQKNIFQKLQQDVRVPISRAKLRKTGKNKHLGYEYFTLDDFLPAAIEWLAKAGLCTIFNIGYDTNGVEMATLTVTDGIDRIVFTIPTSSVPHQEGIFETGSKNTYCKRYLYMNLLELTEPDVAEITNTGKEDKAPKAKAKGTDTKATEKQIEMIRGLYDEENIAKMIEYYGVVSLEELTLKQASQAINKKKGAVNV